MAKMSDHKFSVPPHAASMLPQHHVSSTLTVFKKEVLPQLAETVQQ